MNRLKLFLTIIGLIFCLAGICQRPKDGRYTFSIAFEEWQGRSLGSKCIVHVKGDSVYLIHAGENLSGKKGSIIEKGLLLKHSSGNWVIGRSPEDKNAKILGGCSEAPTIIDFRRKIVRLC